MVEVLPQVGDKVGIAEGYYLCPFGRFLGDRVIVGRLLLFHGVEIEVILWHPEVTGLVGTRRTHEG
jgi:hypothetical protein